MSATRSAGFGHEGQAASSSAPTHCPQGNYDAYYGAVRVRTLIQRDLRSGIRKVRRAHLPDRALHRVSSSAKTEGDPMAMYLGDVAAVLVNLAGVPALSCPAASPREQPARRHPVHRTRTRRRTPLPRRPSTGRTAHRKWGAPLYKSLPDTETLIRDFDFRGTK